jgi:methyltransferase (TIGR00027 family)
VAAARAVESARDDRLFDDPYASLFVKAAAAELAAWATPQGELLRQAMGDYFAIRTRFFDRYLRDAVAAGCRQVVILAAGLDTRAYRCDWPAPVRLFELDRPDVFAFKDTVLAGHPPARGCERIAVVTDLREDWPRDLLAHGFDPREATAWLVEGVLVYLTERDGDRMLARIGELTGAGGELGVEYGSRSMFHSEQAQAALADPAADKQSASALHTLASLWRNESETDPLDWLASHSWAADARELAAAAQEYGRPVPPAFDPAVPGTARIGLITGRR